MPIEGYKYINIKDFLRDELRGKVYAHCVLGPCVDDTTACGRFGLENCILRAFFREQLLNGHDVEELQFEWFKRAIMEGLV